MEINECILTQNDCWKAGRKLEPSGVIVHSTGADNPNIKRYVQPGGGKVDSKLGINQYKNDWNHPGISKCVHAFIGKAADGTIQIYQTLPWDMQGWHCGRGPKGSGNATHIGFEICEDGLKNRDYFLAVYQAAVELAAFLCRKFQLDPLAGGVVICHSEAARLGIASKHADVEHWFNKFDKPMHVFRNDVKEKM